MVPSTPGKHGNARDAMEMDAMRRMMTAAASKMPAIHRDAFLKNMSKQLEVLQDELDECDDDDSDDETDYDDDEEEDEFDRFFNLTYGIKSTASKPTVVKTETVETEKPALSFDRDTIDKVASKIGNEPGITKVIAAPASGKTVALPQQMVVNSHCVMVVVPSETVLADVAVRVPDANIVGLSGTRSGVQDVQYVSAELFGKLKDNRTYNDVTIMIDEAGSGIPAVNESLKVAQRVSQDTQVVEMYGLADHDKMTIADNINVVSRDDIYDYDMSQFNKVLHVVSSEEQLPPDMLHFTKSLDDNIKVITKLKTSAKYDMYVTVPQAIGLHFDVDAVVAPDRIVDVDGRTRLVTYDEHYQLMKRLGRYVDQNGRSKGGTYIGAPNRFMDNAYVTRPRKKLSRGVVGKGFTQGVFDKHKPPDKANSRNDASVFVRVTDVISSAAQELPTTKVYLGERPMTPNELKKLPFALGSSRHDRNSVYNELDLDYPTEARKQIIQNMNFYVQYMQKYHYSTNVTDARVIQVYKQYLRFWKTVQQASRDNVFTYPEHTSYYDCNNKVVSMDVMQIGEVGGIKDQSANFQEVPFLAIQQGIDNRTRLKQILEH